eukprot:GHVS01085261.1.p1 GENE.GHVS01085261.1~~GHVS01085261.1.p1  ORF type:complete len:545 (-),score=42.94 GHVS01085261.1:168-1781(-)
MNNQCSSKVAPELQPVYRSKAVDGIKTGDKDVEVSSVEDDSLVPSRTCGGRRNIRRAVSSTDDLNGVVEFPGNEEETRQSRDGACVVAFAVLATASTVICYADRSNLSVAIISMAEEFSWTKSMQGVVLSSFLLGYSGTQVIGGYWADKFGGKHLLAIALTMWSACTAATPFAARLGTVPLLTVRVVLGAAEGVCFPCIISMIPRIVVVESHTAITSAVIAGSYLGACLAFTAAPFISARYGWPWTFYCFAFLAAVWLPLWMLLVNEQVKPAPSDDNGRYALLHGSRPSEGNNNNSREGMSADQPGRDGKQTASDDGCAYEHDNVATGSSICSSSTGESMSYYSPRVTSAEGAARVLTIQRSPFPVAATGLQASKCQLKIGSEERLSEDLVQTNEQPTSGRETVGDAARLVIRALRHREVWAIIVGQYCNSWGLYGMINWLPSFIHEVYHVDVASLAAMSTIPYLCQAIVAVLIGRVADHLIHTRRWGVKFVRRLLQSLSMLGPALMLWIAVGHSRTPLEVSACRTTVAFATFMNCP